MAPGRKLQQLFIRKIKLVACLTLFIIIYNTAFCRVNVEAKKGVLDLRNWNWGTNGVTDLNGEWEFYWQVLYAPSAFHSANIEPRVYCKVPDFWNSLIPGNSLLKPGTGYATYRLKILCPPS